MRSLTNIPTSMDSLSKLIMRRVSYYLTSERHVNEVPEVVYSQSLCQPFSPGRDAKTGGSVVDAEEHSGEVEMLNTETELSDRSASAACTSFTSYTMSLC
jgi:hypothetical protein